ncbi:hypothetical protein FRC08_016964 [Ceratobasidium sp. 394]|nr:hypothetical protein FRC08_016964 [Ceratobasidium sp. 394]
MDFRYHEVDDFPFDGILHREVSKIRGVVAPAIGDFLLRSRTKSTIGELIRAAIANAITEVAGKHALYVRSHMRINRRRYLNLGELFTTRVYEPGASKVVENALNKAAMAALDAFRMDPNISVGKDWRKEWDEQWKVGWPIIGGKALTKLFEHPDGSYRSLQRKIDQDSWEFLRNRHQTGWMKEFKSVIQLGEPYFLALTQEATSCLSELVPDLDPARLTMGRVPISGSKPPKDSDDMPGARRRIEPALPSFQDIIHQRIEMHCLMVQNSGFGFLAEVRSDIEDVMIEIWISTRDTLGM